MTSLPTLAEMRTRARTALNSLWPRHGQSLHDYDEKVIADIMVAFAVHEVLQALHDEGK